MCEFTSISDVNSVMNEQVLRWTRQVEAQRSQNAMLYNLQESEEFGAVQAFKPMVKNTRKAEL